MKDKVIYQIKDKAIWAVFVIMFIGFSVANQDLCRRTTCL